MKKILGIPLKIGGRVSRQSSGVERWLLLRKISAMELKTAGYVTITISLIYWQKTPLEFGYLAIYIKITNFMTSLVRYPMAGDCNAFGMCG